MKKILLVVTAFFYLCVGAFAGEINIPFITGGEQGWNDLITIDNMADRIKNCRIILYNGGNTLYSQQHTIGPYSSLTVDAKVLAFNATCGVILFDNQAELSCLRCRVAYRFHEGGVVEFELDHHNKSQLAFNFSNNFSDLVQWKGIAVMNSGLSTQSITLYALGKGQILGTAYDNIPARGKISGLHSRWFPQVGLNDIESIVITSLNAPLAGITISGDYAFSKLLFTPAAAVMSFKDLNNPELQLAKRLIGAWSFVESYEDVNFTTQELFWFLRIDSFNSQNNSYELKVFSAWLTGENVKAYYSAGRKYYSLQYEYGAINGAHNTKIYKFTFMSDTTIQGVVNVYNSQGTSLGTGNLYGQFTGTIFNNNADLE